RARPADHRRMAREGGLGHQADPRNAGDIAEDGQPSCRSEVRSRSPAEGLQKRKSLDQAGVLCRSRYLYASRLLSDFPATSGATGSGTGLARWILLSVPSIEVRPCRTRL